MLRSSAPRSLLRTFTKASPASRLSYSAASPKLNPTLPSRWSSKRPQLALPPIRPTTTSLYYATKDGPPFDRKDEKHEHEVAESKIEAHPEDVSMNSTMRPVFEPSEKKPAQQGALRSDLETIKDTFALTEVPRESLYIGAAGVLPYAATSISTVYLAWDINHAHANNGMGYMFSPETAHQLLDMVTPIQVGYGAVVSIQVLLQIN